MPPLYRLKHNDAVTEKEVDDDVVATPEVGSDFGIVIVLIATTRASYY